MNVIILSHMYPRKHAPYSGIFVEEQVQAINDMIGGDITVISPLPWAPRVLWFNKKWRDYGQVEKETTRNGVRIYHPRYLAIPGKVLALTQSYFIYRAAISLLRKIGIPDRKDAVLHCHFVLPDGLAGVFLKKKLGFGILCTAHGNDINTYPFRNKLTYLLTSHSLKRVDGIVAISAKMKELIQTMADGKEVHVVTNGVDPLKMSADIERIEDCDAATGDITLLFVGNICTEKGICELLRAFVGLKEEYGGLKLILVGLNTMGDWIEAFIEENDLHDSVRVTGPVAHSEVKKYYCAASIFVLPSYSEGMPTVMFEAMVSRLPIVISKVGGVGEIIEDGVNGLLVEPRSEHDLRDKLRMLIDSNQLRQSISSRAYEDVISKYTWRHNACRMVEIYQETLDRANGKSSL